MRRRETAAAAANPAVVGVGVEAEFRAPKISVLEKGSCISTSHDDHNDCRQSVVLPYNTGPTHLNFILDVDCTLVSKHIDSRLSVLAL